MRRTCNYLNCENMVSMYSYCHEHAKEFVSSGLSKYVKINGEQKANSNYLECKKLGISMSELATYRKVKKSETLTVFG